jgi:hypothetical protein
MHVFPSLAQLLLPGLAELSMLPGLAPPLILPGLAPLLLSLKSSFFCCCHPRFCCR